MKNVLILFFVIFSIPSARAQSYADSIERYRESYRQEFIDHEHSPLGVQDTSFLRFFAPDIKYRVTAELKLTPEATPFKIPTSSGKSKTYRKYGVLNFTLRGEPCKLEVYESPELMKKEEFKDHLFIPFKDLTNYEETYGGGRYLDVSRNEIVNHTIVIDFNKAYNPYCAYTDGYNCPIPPEANRLSLKIEAGEKMFGKKMHE